MRMGLVPTEIKKVNLVKHTTSRPHKSVKFNDAHVKSVSNKFIISGRRGLTL